MVFSLPKTLLSNCTILGELYPLTDNQTDIKPTKVHGDTHAQSTPIFGLSYLLAISLMPRIRNIKDLIFYRPHKETRYEHIDTLFSEAIRWDIIETHLPDMLRIVLSIQAGKISASTILRRLGHDNRKNKVYFAFRELGRAVRTEFLLRYLSDVQLRKTIHAVTCKNEEFNGFLKWSFFGGEGIIAENNRYEQSKIIKYNHLVANLLILHNVEAMTRVINTLTAEGYDVNEAIIREIAPYRTQHINRFGSYTLNLAKPVQPLQFDMPIYIKAVNKNE